MADQPPDPRKIFQGGLSAPSAEASEGPQPSEQPQAPALANSAPALAFATFGAAQSTTGTSSHSGSVVSSSIEVVTASAGQPGGAQETTAPPAPVSVEVPHFREISIGPTPAAEPFMMFNPLMANFIRTMPESEWQRLQADMVQRQASVLRQGARRQLAQSLGDTLMSRMEHSQQTTPQKPPPQPVRRQSVPPSRASTSDDSSSSSQPRRKQK